MSDHMLGYMLPTSNINPSLRNADCIYSVQLSIHGPKSAISQLCVGYLLNKGDWQAKGRIEKCHTVWQEIFAEQNYHDFHGFASDHKNFNCEILPTMQATPFFCNRCGLLSKQLSQLGLASVCAMAILLAALSSSIVLANVGVKSVLEESIGEGKWAVMSSCCLMVRHKLESVLLSMGWLQQLHPRHLHKCGIHAPSLQH